MEMPIIFLNEKAHQYKNVKIPKDHLYMFKKIPYVFGKGGDSILKTGFCVALPCAGARRHWGFPTETPSPPAANTLGDPRNPSLCL